MEEEITCLYFHKLPNGKIFYVGIGDKKRPYVIASRNKFWINEVNKYGLEKENIEIIYKNISWKEACKLEKTYIKLFGRRDLGLGTLVNLTDGGDGCKGAIRSQETKNKISNSKKGIATAPIKSIIQYSLNGDKLNTFISLKEAALSLNVNTTSARCFISQCANGKRKTAYGSIWKFKNNYKKYIYDRQYIQNKIVNLILLDFKPSNFINANSIFLVNDMVNYLLNNYKMDFIFTKYDIIKTLKTLGFIKATRRSNNKDIRGYIAISNKDLFPIISKRKMNKSLIIRYSK